MVREARALSAPRNFSRAGELMTFWGDSEGTLTGDEGLFSSLLRNALLRPDGLGGRSNGDLPRC